MSNFLYDFTRSMLSCRYDILVFFFLLTLIISPYQVHMGLQNIEMGAGSGQLPLVCLHHRDINMQLFLSMHGFMSQEGLLEVVAW
jgi:hypothetical protein